MIKVLISGAGIAGLSLARALQDDDRFEITLIEKRSQPPTNTAGIALPPNAVAALRKLNLGDALDNIAHQVHTIFYTDAQQRVLAEGSLLEPPLNYDKFVALSRENLRVILVEGLIPPIHYGTTIVDIQNTLNGVKVTLNTDPDQEEEYDLVVAAEGIHSTLRVSEAEHHGPLKDLGVVNWRFLLHCSTENIEPTYQFGDVQNKLLMTYPISENQVYIYAHLRAPNESLDTLKNIDFIKASFAEFGGLAEQMLEKLDHNVSVITGRLQSVPNANFYNKRVVFVGDTANACSPLLQQGAAAALEDILTLSTMLKHYPIPQALEKYQSLRKERVEWLIKSSDGPLAMMENVNRIFGDWLGSTFRNFLFRMKGPLNVAGWRTLFATDPLSALDLKPNNIPKQYSDSEDSSDDPSNLSLSTPPSDTVELEIENVQKKKAKCS